MISRQKRTTILDVAREAKTSTATVSRVLSNADYPVSAELRRTVRKVVEKLNYRPNIFGQVLKGGVNRVIGIIVPAVTNPFYAQLSSDVERHCVERGYAPIICSSHNSGALEQDHLEMLLRHQVAGILLSTINTRDSFFRKLGAMPVPRVLFDQPPAGYRGHNIRFDFQGGGFMAVEHLIRRGHRRILFASQRFDRASRKLYHKGYADALRRAGLETPESLTITEAEEAATPHGGGDFIHGRILVEKLLRLKQLPDAVVASNDIVAIGMINALRERGVQVPRDVSIIGFDDIDFAAVMTPALTTVRQSTARTAEMAMNLLFENIDKPDMRPVRLDLEPELVERDSVAEAGGAIS